MKQVAAHRNKEKVQYIAHRNKEKVQYVKEHLENVAELTKKFCEDYRVPKTDICKYAYETGLAHDIGKYQKAFQRKITQNQNIFVDHSTAGAREMKNNKRLAASFAIAGHHGGIPNGKDLTNQNLITRVKEKKLEPYEDYKEEINLEEKVPEPKFSDFGDCEAFEESFFIRMLFSALVDADFLDTESFMNPAQTERGNYDSIGTLYEKVMDYIAPLRELSDKTSEINKIRTSVLEQCLKRGEGKRGLYSLTVPTGGGKTVSSLAFALTHAKKNEMKRIIYVIPYISIIEQTVKIFREILGEQNVLAHYSNCLLDSETAGKDCCEKHKLSIENWDAPVIVTTNVQFFESLYSNKVSKCRKLHNIANAVIVFDEAQMIPLNCLKPCVKAIQNLIAFYQVSAVFCTATQPALNRWMSPIPIEEICPNYKELFKTLKRTSIRDAGKRTEKELLERVVSQNQILVIVNTKREAQELYQKLPKEEGSYHLSTYMTPTDRRAALEAIYKRLLNGEQCRVISTSLVEAGVDLDFPVVWREMAGLDSIIQAAGRCNREGKAEAEKSVVWVFRLGGKVPDAIVTNVALTKETLQRYGYDDLEAISDYFESLQNLDDGSLDRYHVIEGFEGELGGVEMPFKKISDTFHLLSSDCKMLIIPIAEEATTLTGELLKRIEAQENFKITLRKLGMYSINIYQNEYERLLGDNSAYEAIDGVAVLQNLELYSKEMGLYCEKTDGAAMV